MIDYRFTYGDLEIFLLILMRVASFVLVAPFFSMANTPQNVRVGFSFFLSILLYGSAPVQTLEYHTVAGYAIIVIKEVMTGILIGYSATMVNYIANFAGQIADMQTGLSMVTIFDPNSREQVTISGSLYQYAFIGMMMVSGMYRYVLRGLTDSYLLIPVNGAIFDRERLLASMAGFLAGYITIGFRICMPLFIVTFILNVVLGIMAKVAPQLNMFAVGMQIKVLVGLGILFLTSSLMYSASDFIFTNMRKLMQEFALDLQG